MGHHVGLTFTSKYNNYRLFHDEKQKQAGMKKKALSLVPAKMHIASRKSNEHLDHLDVFPVKITVFRQQVEMCRQHCRTAAHLYYFLYRFLVYCD